MIISSLNKDWLRLARRQKLRTIVIVPFVLQIVGAVGLVSYLSFRNGQRAVEDLANQLTTEVDARIADHLDTYLPAPNQVNELNQAALELGHLDVADLTTMEQHFERQSQVFELISYIQFGGVDGEFVGLAVNDDGSRNYQVTEKTGELHTYSINADGSRGELLKTAPDFDPRDRPWYTVPEAAGKPAWTDIYAWVDPPTLAITLGQPHYDANGNFQGILATDLTLAQISDFLRSLTIGKTGQTFIFDRSGSMIATSSDKEEPFITTEEGPVQLFMHESQDSLTLATIDYLNQTLASDLGQISTAEQHRLEVEGRTHFLHISPLNDEYGLDWLTVVVVPEADFMEQIVTNNRTTAFLCIASLLLATGAGVLTARWVTQPILLLNEAAKNITAGNYDDTPELDRRDELGGLGRSFKIMALQLKTSFQKLQSVNQALAESQAELAETNRSLELQVQQRTEKLVQSEKLAALGQLTAGIAHEINTPLGAIQASGNNIATALEESMASLPILLRQLPEEQLQAFLKLLSVSQEPRALMSSRETRALRKAWQKQLTHHGIEQARVLAESLSAMAVPVEPEPFLVLLQASNSQEIIEVAYGLSVISNGTANIQLAVARAAKIVFALKSYTRQDYQEKRVLASIPETLETVLTLYQNQLKHNVDISRNYLDIPKIYCYPEPLAQVWTNLIYNALQAMDYQGRLEIKMEECDRHIVVSITDSGSGIPPEIQARIFDPFFTTKGAGEGSGLGLDIVNKIVQKHQGRIELESQPGRTTFHVWLSMELTAEDETVQAAEPTENQSSPASDSSQALAAAHETSESQTSETSVSDSQASETPAIQT